MITQLCQYISRCHFLVACDITMNNQKVNPCKKLNQGFLNCISIRRTFDNEYNNSALHDNISFPARKNALFIEEVLVEQ